MIKVLFVSSGNAATGISPITKNQGDSLKKYANLDYFTIDGKGMKGYIKAIPKLRKIIKNNSYDIIHAHYSLSAFTASLGGAKPLIVSLMGSDVSAKKYFKFIIKFFNYFFWKKVIVKSDDMKRSLGIKEVHVIPNGVNFDKFKPIDKFIALKKTEWNSSKQHILFAANPTRLEKNYKIAKEAFDLLDNSNLELHFLENVSNNEMPYYFNAADVVLLTSLREGSPNVIKEAMACNAPIVSTNVGDVKQILKDTKGCFIVNDDARDISDKIIEALSFNQETTGRNDMQYLNSDIVAKKIMNIYSSVLNKSSEYAQ